MSGSQKITLPNGDITTRRRLVIEGRRLVVFDLGLTDTDSHLAQRHQEKYLGHLLRVQFHTWFKTVALRAYRGWDQAHCRKLSVAEREQRLSVARGEFVGRMPTAETGGTKTPPHLAAAAASALRKREAVRTG